MVLIRPFKEEDNKVLLNIEKLCPRGDERLAMMVDLDPDITARYELYDNWEILVAEEDGQTAGWIGWTVKNNADEKYIYVAEYMVHPDFRKKGIATGLIKEVEKRAEEINASHIYSYEYAPNEASRKLMDKLGYIRQKEVRVCEMSAYKKEDVNEKYTLEHVDEKDLPEAVELLNRYYAGRTHFTPFTAESFKEYANRMLGYGLENFLVAKEGEKVVACGGLWDSALVMEMVYTREPLFWKVMERLLGLLRHVKSLPIHPRVGENFMLRSIVDHAFEPGYEEAMDRILGFCNNIMYDTRCKFLGTYIDPDDPLLELIKHRKPKCESMHLYAKPIQGELPDFSSLYVDCRDPIL
ncbi:GNAT family N-acetyltransferase [Methanolobus sp. ZRKC3]|uniref:GNAT family N-acetyltransferase n=1 Tax=Methanolobus sp. ZRKC3 TaxID=3125786 RepID=UPI003244EE7F